MDFLEKIVAGFGGLCLVTTAILYLLLQTPSPMPTEFVPGVLRVTPTVESGSTTKTGPENAAEYDGILQKLRTQSPRIRRRPIEPVEYAVPVELYEHVNKPANMTRELNKARHRILQTKNGQTRLQVHGIAEDSQLRKFGLEDNDIIELIDGEIVEFRQDTTTKLYDLWRGKLEKLRQGERVSLTISRGNVPMHLEFNLGNL